MTFNNNDFKVRWKDKEGHNREKVYTDYTLAQKAYKWLNDNGAIADIAVIKRIKPSEDGEESKPSMFPSK